MARIVRLSLIASAALLALGASLSAQQNAMTFFVTSVGSGKGADLGGLAGADRLCQTLATAVGAGGRTWRAYLSAKAANGQPAVNAKDRIGNGPWYNAKGMMVAKSIADLHSDANNLKKDTALFDAFLAERGRIHLLDHGRIHRARHPIQLGRGLDATHDGAAAPRQRHGALLVTLYAPTHVRCPKASL